MKTAELTALGVAEEVAKQILAINGKDIEAAKAAKDKEIQALTTERDGLQTQLTTVQEALKKFDGVDPEKLQADLQAVQQQLEDANKSFAAQILARDQDDWLQAQFGEEEGRYDVKSPFARKQIMAEVKDPKKGLKWQPAEAGKPAGYLGFGDFMAQAKKDDPSLYLTKEEKEVAAKQQQQQGTQPRFTGPAGDPQGSGGEKYVPPIIF